MIEDILTYCIKLHFDGDPLPKKKFVPRPKKTISFSGNCSTTTEMMIKT